MFRRRPYLALVCGPLLVAVIAAVVLIVLVPRRQSPSPATSHRPSEPEGSATDEPLSASTPTAGDASDRALAKLLGQRGLGPVRGSAIAGHVKSLTRIGDNVGHQAVAKLLRQHGAAPVAAGMYPAPNELKSQVPPVTPDTPDVPAPPARWRSARGPWGWSTVRGGDVAAAIYGRDARPGPVGLVVAEGKRGSARRFEHVLAEKATLETSRLILFSHAHGLFIWVLADSQSGRREQQVFIALSTDWVPERVASPAHQYGDFRPVGRTLDGNTVYMLERGEPGAASPVTLWQVDCLHKTLRRINASLPDRIDYVLPSPDGAFVATGMEPPVPGPLMCPMYILDRRSGEIVAATLPGRHGYHDRPLAWSAKVPGRLFLSRIDGGVWQLDLDVGQLDAERRRN